MSTAAKRKISRASVGYRGPAPGRPRIRFNDGVSLMAAVDAFLRLLLLDAFSAFARISGPPGEVRTR